MVRQPGRGTACPIFAGILLVFAASLGVGTNTSLVVHAFGQLVLTPSHGVRTDTFTGSFYWPDQSACKNGYTAKFFWDWNQYGETYTIGDVAFTQSGPDCVAVDSTLKPPDGPTEEGESMGFDDPGTHTIVVAAQPATLSESTQVDYILDTPPPTAVPTASNATSPSPKPLGGIASTTPDASSGSHALFAIIILVVVVSTIGAGAGLLLRRRRRKAG